MNNLSANSNFESSPNASPMELNSNTSIMMGGKGKRRNKRKGGMNPVPDIMKTPEKETGSRVAPIFSPEKVKPQTLFKNVEIDIESAKDEDYDELLKDIIKEENKIVETDNKNKDILDKLESGEFNSENVGGKRTRRRTRKTKRNKNKKNKHSKKSRKTRKTRKFHKN